MRTALKILVAGVLLVAGSIKLSAPQTFALDISYYRLLPVFLLQPSAYVVPVLEVLVALALFHRRYEPAAWMLSTALFAAFAVAVGSAVVRGLDISCGCFGSALTVSWYHLAGNLVATVLCALCYFKASSFESTARP